MASSIHGLPKQPHQAEAACGPGRNSLRGIDGETETVFMPLGRGKPWFEPRRHGSEDGGGHNAIDRKGGEREVGGKDGGSQG